MSENKFLKQAKEELAYLSGDENFKFLVEDRTRFLMDQAAREQKSFSEGLSEGEKKKQLEIAKKLLELNIPIEKIVSATGLSKDEIEKL